MSTKLVYVKVDLPIPNPVAPSKMGQDGKEMAAVMIDKTNPKEMKGFAA